MTVWRKKKPQRPAEIPDDIGEARDMRQAAERDRIEAIRTGHVVDRVTGYLNERRALNHFGESIEITFTRRGHA